MSATTLTPTRLRVLHAAGRREVFRGLDDEGWEHYGKAVNRAAEWLLWAALVSQHGAALRPTAAGWDAMRDARALQ